MASKEEVAHARANLARFLQQASTLNETMFHDVEEVIQSITDEELDAQIDATRQEDTKQ